MSTLESPRIAKTFKLFIGGEFPRTESGRSLPVYQHKSKKLFAHLCRASRKDLRNAVTAAQGAQAGWASKTAYNRGQILYRMAEMCEGKRLELCEVLTATMGLSNAQANKAVDQAIDAFVYYAGFSDKYTQIAAAVNPVAGPHHNFTTAESVGVVGLIAAETLNLGDLVARISAIIVSGNSLVCLLGSQGSAIVAPLAEVFATSDLPKGVVNLLTGLRGELLEHFASHMEIHSLSLADDLGDAKGKIKEAAAANLKRVVSDNADETLSLESILNFVEYKTVWHPMGY